MNSFMSLQFGLVFYWRGRKNLFTCKHLTSSFIDMVVSFCQLIVNRNYCIQRKITCWCTQYVLFTPHSSTVTCFLSFANFRIRGPVCPAQHLSKCGKELGPFSHVLEVRGCSQVNVLTLSLSISILSWFLKELVSHCFLLLSVSFNPLLVESYINSASPSCPCNFFKSWQPSLSFWFSFSGNRWNITSVTIRRCYFFFLKGS